MTLLRKVHQSRSSIITQLILSVSEKLNNEIHTYFIHNIFHILYLVNRYQGPNKFDNAKSCNSNLNGKLLINNKREGLW